MDFDQQNDYSAPEQPQQPQQPSQPARPVPPQYYNPPKKSGGWKVFWGIFIAMSVIANFFMFFLLIIFGAAALGGGTVEYFEEQVIQKGPGSTRIAVINLAGVIDGDKFNSVYNQIKNAREDHSVKALILRVNSPGGGVSASDRIYNEVAKYRRETNKPVVAFMQGIAASGGYYASVACNRIVAEPTTITGSIGVIMGYFVFQDLLEDKLGIQPIVVKSGLKKDWPSTFEPPSEEQKQYLKDKLIDPAYSRFLEVVDDGRTSLTLEQVKKLADGSIYPAKEALEEDLIDDIGYIDEAIKQAKKLAGISRAEVIQYKKPFSFADLLGSKTKSVMNIDKTKLYELSTPELMYLWSAR